MIGNRQIKSSSLQDWKEPIDLKKKKSKSRTRRVNEGKKRKEINFHGGKDERVIIVPR